MKKNTSCNSLVRTGYKLPLAIIFIILLIGTAYATWWIGFSTTSSVKVDVIIPFVVKVSNESGEPIEWSDSLVLNEPGSGEPMLFWLNVTKATADTLGDVVLQLNVTNSGNDFGCADISSINVSNSTGSIWNPVMLSSVCSAVEGHALINFTNKYDSINPVLYNFSISFANGGSADSYNITGLIKASSKATGFSNPITMFSGESRAVQHLMNCSLIEVHVNGSLPIMAGDYNLSNCSQYEVDKWNCNATSGFELWLNTMPNSVNTYNITSFCLPELNSSGGTGDGSTGYEQIEVCESFWTSCVDGLSYRYCHKGELNTTRVKNCSTNVVCTMDWSCSEWGTCGSNNIQLRSCTDLNECNITGSMPAVSQSCNYTNTTNTTNNTDTSCTEDWQCSDWGSCRSDSTQIRGCADANICGTTVSKPAESQSCSYNGGNSGGGGGSSGGGSSGGDGGSDRGWICEPYGPCIDGKMIAFCYRDNTNMKMNYTVSEKCIEEKINASVPKINETEPINIPPVKNVTGNQTELPKQGPTGITGLFGALLPKQPWQWALLALILLALIGYGIYRLLKGKGIAAAGKKKKKKGRK